MVKLIDGGMLVNVFDEEDPNDPFNKVVVHIVKSAVNKAPEVDAIPVKWIEAKTKKLKDMDGGYSCLAADILYGILLEWRREQK